MLDILLEEAWRLVGELDLDFDSDFLKCFKSLDSM